MAGSLPNQGIFDHLNDLVTIISPLITVIVLLVSYAWNAMNKTQKDSVEALDNHIEKDDDIHDKIFTSIRELEKQVSHLQGEHDVTKDKCNRCPYGTISRPDHEEYT